VTGWWVRRGFWRSCRLVLGVAVATGVSAHLLSDRAAAAPLPPPPTTLTITVTLSPSTIVADGVSTSTVTASLQFDGLLAPLPGRGVTFSSSDSGIRFGPTMQSFSGTYTAVLTSSTVAGTPTITATARMGGQTVSGQATLTQTPGAARQMTLSLAPPSIPADGRTYTTATATVADAHGNPVSTDTVVFSSSNRHQEILPVANDGTGRYSALIVSSTRAGPVVIQATDTTAGLSAQAELTQTRSNSVQLLVTLQWMFQYTPTYTRVLSLIVSDAPVGTRALVHCHGDTCPFTQHRSRLAATRPCGRKGRRRCATDGTIGLTRYFDGRDLGAGTRITVALSPPSSTGKYYRFEMRAGRAPRVLVTCLAPGQTQPNGAC
jgi:invasin-like protein